MSVACDRQWLSFVERIWNCTVHDPQWVLMCVPTLWLAIGPFISGTWSLNSVVMIHLRMFPAIWKHASQNVGKKCALGLQPLRGCQAATMVSWVMQLQPFVWGSDHLQAWLLNLNLEACGLSSKPTTGYHKLQGPKTRSSTCKLGDPNRDYSMIQTYSN